MADQSGIQQFIQKNAGTHTTGQASTPSAVNNGSPNTVYNVAPITSPATWGTYVPTTTPGTNGAPPSTTFDLVQAPYQPSNPGHVSPFTADPTVAALMSQMPQAQGNTLINNLLQNMSKPRTPTPNPGTPGPVPGTPNPLPPVVVPPVTGPGTRPGNPGPRPVGPISGPVDGWIRSPNTGQPGSVVAPTTLFQSGQGRQAALEWLSTGTGRSVGDWLSQNTDMFNSETGGMNQDSSLWQSIQQGISNLGGALGNELRSLWNNATGQNGWQSAVGFWATVAGIPGASQIINALVPEGTVPFDTSEITAGQEELNADMAQQLWADQQDRIDAHFQSMLQGGMTEDQIRQAFPESDQSWTPQQWQQMTETMNWNNFWQGNGQAAASNPNGVRQPTLGLPALDNVDAFLNNMSRHNLEIHNWFQNMRGRARQ